MTKRAKPASTPRHKTPRTGDRVPLALRTTPSLQSALVEAANRHGRSLSQETEYRLERSFERQELLVEALELRYGTQIAALMLMAGEAMESALECIGINGVQAKLSPPGAGEAGAAPSDLDWLSDRFAYEKATTAAALALKLFAPKGSGETSPAAKAAQRPGAWARDPVRQAVNPILAELQRRVTVNGRDPLERVRPLLKTLPAPPADLPESPRLWD